MIVKHLVLLWKNFIETQLKVKAHFILNKFKRLLLFIFLHIKRSKYV